MVLHFTSLLEYGVQHISNMHHPTSHCLCIFNSHYMIYTSRLVTHIPAITCIGGALYDALDHPPQDQYASGT